MPTASITGYQRLKLRREILISLPRGAVQANCLSAASEPTLFLDHLPLRGLPTTGRYYDRTKGLVQIAFRLDKPASGAAAWNELLHRAWAKGGAWDVTVGIGAGGSEFITLDKPVTLHLGTGERASAQWALGLSALVLAVVASTSRALEDRRTGTRSYSLSRLMLACWAITTCAVVIVVWRHTEALPSFSDGGLALMLAASGLGAGFSTVLDTLRKANNAAPTCFARDLLNDEDGLAIHRVQALVFTIIVLYVVWRELIDYGSVAQIDKTWSLLLGASTVTYLFGRASEDSTAKIAADRPSLLQGLLKSVQPPAGAGDVPKDGGA